MEDMQRVTFNILINVTLEMIAIISVLLSDPFLFLLCLLLPLRHETRFNTTMVALHANNFALKKIFPPFICLLSFFSSSLLSITIGWLEDAALFAAIDQSVDTFTWNEWPEPLKNRHLGALEEAYRTHKDYVRSLLFLLF